ncbi:hypothetical protein HDU67_001332 [Dinochytrium kinnereticum]|nr:hypothetical protein HDU67_001332 [Dinochytrium kinnereticum]
MILQSSSEEIQIRRRQRREGGADTPPATLGQNAVANLVLPTATGPDPAASVGRVVEVLSRTYPSIDPSFWPKYQHLIINVDTKSVGNLLKKSFTKLSALRMAKIAGRLANGGIDSAREIKLQGLPGAAVSASSSAVSSLAKTVAIESKDVRDVVAKSQRISNDYRKALARVFRETPKNSDLCIELFDNLQFDFEDQRILAFNDDEFMGELKAGLQEPDETIPSDRNEFLKKFSLRSQASRVVLRYLQLIGKRASTVPSEMKEIRAEMLRNDQKLSDLDKLDFFNVGASFLARGMQYTGTDKQATFRDAAPYLTLTNKMGTMRNILSGFARTFNQVPDFTKFLENLKMDSAPGDDILNDDNLMNIRPQKFAPKSLYKGCSPSCSTEKIRFPQSIKDFFQTLKNLAPITEYRDENTEYSGVSLMGADGNGKLTVDGVREALMFKVNLISSEVKDHMETFNFLARSLEKALTDTYEQMENEELTFETFLGSEIGKQFMVALQSRFKLTTRPPPRQKVSQKNEDKISEEDLDQSFRALLSQFEYDLGERFAINVNEKDIAKAFDSVNVNLLANGGLPIQTRDEAVDFIMDRYATYLKSETPTKLLQNYIGQARYHVISALAPNSPGGYDYSSGVSSDYLVDKMNQETKRMRVELFTPAIPDEVIAQKSLLRAVRASFRHAQTLTDPKHREEQRRLMICKEPPDETPSDDAPLDFEHFYSTNSHGQPTASLKEVIQKLDGYVMTFMKEPETEDDAFLLRYVINNVRQTVKYMQQKLLATASGGSKAAASSDDKQTYDALLKLEDSLAEIEQTQKASSALEAIGEKMPTMLFEESQKSISLDSAEGLEYKGGALTRLAPRPQILLRPESIVVDTALGSMFQQKGVPNNRVIAEKVGSARAGWGFFRPSGKK